VVTTAQESLLSMGKSSQVLWIKCGCLDRALYFHDYNTSSLIPRTSGITYYIANACQLLDEQSPSEDGSKCNNGTKAGKKARASGDRDSRGTCRRVGAAGRKSSGVGGDKLEVGAGDASLVGKVEDETTVAEEGSANLLGDG